MTPEEIIGIGREALFTAIMVSAPILIVGLAIGLIISIFQAVTQIQEMTLTFVPKIFAIILVILLTGKWMAQVMISYTTKIIEQLPGIAG